MRSDSAPNRASWALWSERKSKFPRGFSKRGISLVHSNEFNQVCIRRLLPTERLVGSLLWTTDAIHYFADAIDALVGLVGPIAPTVGL